MSLSTSPEFYVNMKNPPVWNDLFGWEDQDDDVKQFFKEEAYKVKYGVTINGTFIPPWPPNEPLWRPPVCWPELRKKHICRQKSGLANTGKGAFL